MEALDMKALRRETKETLRGERDLPKLILMSSGVVVLYNVLLLVFGLIAEKAIAGAGGLGGLQTRAVWTTAQYLLQEIGLVLMPFWQMGVIRAAICRHRGQETQKNALLFGFARFGPLLGFWLILGFALIAVIMTCVNVASVLFAFTPMGQDASMFLASYMGENMDYATLLEQVPMDQLVMKFLPAYILAAVIAVPVVYFVWCKFRMADYVILDDDKTRAFPAILKSVAMTGKQFWSFLWLDLSFWWYYLLLVPVTAFGYADILLPALGVRADPEMLRYVGLGLNYVCTLLLAWFVQPRLEMTYAAVYDGLNRKLQEKIAQQEQWLKEQREKYGQ